VLPAVWYHKNSTRRDLVKHFTSQDCIRDGSAGLIHVCHVIAEIAFKVGLVSKYGA